MRRPQREGEAKKGAAEEDPRRGLNKFYVEPLQCELLPWKVCVAIHRLYIGQQSSSM